MNRAPKRRRRAKNRQSSSRENEHNTSEMDTLSNALDDLSIHTTLVRGQ